LRGEAEAIFVASAPRNDVEEERGRHCETKPKQPLPLTLLAMTLEKSAVRHCEARSAEAIMGRKREGCFVLVPRPRNDVEATSSLMFHVEQLNIN
jgi:hypothetical protein